MTISVPMRPDADLLEAIAQEQWMHCHFLRCGGTWPHKEGERCGWPHPWMDEVEGNRPYAKYTFKDKPESHYIQRGREEVLRRRIVGEPVSPSIKL